MVAGSSSYVVMLGKELPRNVRGSVTCRPYVVTNPRMVMRTFDRNRKSVASLFMQSCGNGET
jgi:hypothetical protein